MNKLIHSILNKLGYKISNIGKKEKQIQDLVSSFGVKNDTNNLVYNSASYLFEIKKHFPELVLEGHKEGVLASFNGLQFYLESSEEFFIIKEVFIENPKERVLGIEEYSMPWILPIPFTPSGFSPSGMVVKM